MVSADLGQQHSFLHDASALMKKHWLTKLKNKALLLRGSSLLLPVLPLSLSAIIGLFQARALKVGISLLACACFIYAAKCTRHYYRQLAQVLQEDQALSEIRDSRGQGLTAFTLAILLLSAYLLRHPLWILLGTLAGAGSYYFHYMQAQQLPPSADNPPPHNDTRHLSPTLQAMIADAENHSAALWQLSEAYRQHPLSAVRALSEKIRISAQRAQRLISLCAQEADNIRRLRPFFIVQLPEILSICQACLQENPEQSEHLAQLDRLLDSVNHTFAEQSRALLAHDNIQLHSKMDVLRQQLESSHDKQQH